MRFVDELLHRNRSYFRRIVRIVHSCVVCTIEKCLTVHIGEHHAVAGSAAWRY